MSPVPSSFPGHRLERYPVRKSELLDAPADCPARVPRLAPALGWVAAGILLPTTALLSLLNARS